MRCFSDKESLTISMQGILIEVRYREYKAR